MTSVQSPTIIVKPFGVHQQAIVMLGDMQFVVGSAMIRETKSQPSRPLELLLATLATDCTFTCQEGAVALGLPLNNFSALAQWLDPKTAEIRFTITGSNEQQMRDLIRYIKENSTIYKLLAPGVTINLRFHK